MLYRILQDSAQRLPDAVAIRYGAQVYSYTELLNLVDSLAAALQAMGLGTGDRLAFYLYNRPELVISYFACFKLGITVVPINYRLRESVHYIIRHSKPKVLISEHALFANIAGMEGEFASVEHYYLVDATQSEKNVRPFSELLREKQDAAGMVDIPAATVAAVLYTSGTTGKPKGAELAHDQMMCHTRGHCDLVQYSSVDNTLVCLALSNNFAFSHQMLSALHAGATLVINATFDPAQVLDRIERDDISLLYMMPVMYHALNEAAAARGGRIPNRLRLAVVAGDATPDVTMERFRELFGLDMCEGIGMTETQVYALNPLGTGKKRGSVGRPVPYMEVSVQDDNGSVLDAGETGEIAVRGEIVMRRYLDNPGVTSASFRNGWFLTGDMGCFDEEGYLWFRGRRKQLILHDGSNISPQEVEEVLCRHPGVFEVGVVGIPDKFEGELVHAFVALKPDAAPVSEAELLAFAGQHLAEYKLPEGITFIDSLPKGSTGKIDRKLLRTYPRC